MAVSDPFALGTKKAGGPTSRTTNLNRTTAVSPFGLAGGASADLDSEGNPFATTMPVADRSPQSSWMTSNSPEYGNYLGQLQHQNEVSGGVAPAGPLTWDNVLSGGSLNPQSLGFSGEARLATPDPSGEGDTRYSANPEFTSYLESQGYRPGMESGTSGAYASDSYGVVGPDGQPVAGSQWRAPVDTGSDLRDGVFMAAGLYGAGSALSGAINGAGAGVGTTGSGPAAGGAQSGALAQSGTVPSYSFDAASLASPSAQVGGGAASSGITAQQALGGASALGGAGDFGGGEGVDPDMGVPQGSGSGGDPTRQALYGAEGYGQGMTGAQTAAYDSSLNGQSGAMPEWLSSFGQQFGGDAQRLLSQLILARGVQAMGPSAPAAPDYSGLANQQTQNNQQTAEFNANLNRVNTTTPMGSQTFNRVADPTAPGGYRYESNISFSPEQQALYQSETANQQAMQDLAGQMQGRVGAGLANPFSLGGVGEAGRVNADPTAFSAERDQVTQALYDRMTRTREPAMERARQQLDTRLKNQGLMPGTEAYDNAMQTMLEAQSGELQDITSRAVEMGGAEQTRLNNALLANTGFNNQTRSQGIQELLLERQQPLTEFNSLRTGNTPTLPSFQPFGFSQAAPTNVMAPAQMQYGANIDNYNARVGQYQNLLNFLTKGSGG